MKRIFKYPLKVEDYQVVKLPKGAEILTVQVQKVTREEICLWAIIDDEELRNEEKHFYLLGTGHAIENEELKSLKYIATIQWSGGVYVWHLFEKV